MCSTIRFWAILPKCSSSSVCSTIWDTRVVTLRRLQPSFIGESSLFHDGDVGNFEYSRGGSFVASVYQSPPSAAYIRR